VHSGFVCGVGRLGYRPNSRAWANLTDLPIIAFQVANGICCFVVRVYTDPLEIHWANLTDLPIIAFQVANGICCFGFRTYTDTLEIHCAANLDITRFTAHGLRDLVRICVVASWLAEQSCRPAALLRKRCHSISHTSGTNLDSIVFENMCILDLSVVLGGLVINLMHWRGQI